MSGNWLISSPDVRSFYCQLSSVASYHGLAMSVVIIRCRTSYYNEEWMVVVAEEYLVNHGRTTSRNGQGSRCRHCCASRLTEVSEQLSQQMHLSKYANNAWASRPTAVLVSYLLDSDCTHDTVGWMLTLCFSCIFFKNCMVLLNHDVVN